MVSRSITTTSSAGLLAAPLPSSWVECRHCGFSLYSTNHTIVKWQGRDWHELPLLIGALLNAHHALHLWQISPGSYHGSRSVWRCCLLCADVQTSLGVGEPRSSLRGCNETALKLILAHLWQGLTMEVPDRLLGRQLWKGLVWHRTRRKEMSGRMGWRAPCQFSSGDINLASNIAAHQKKKHASSLRLALYLAIPFFSLCYQGEGLTSPTPAKTGWFTNLSSLPSLPLVMGLAREEREVRAAGREKGKKLCARDLHCDIKSLDGWGSLPAWWGARGGRSFSFSLQLHILENGSLSQVLRKHTFVFFSLDGCF